jgi:integrase
LKIIELAVASNRTPEDVARLLEAVPGTPNRVAVMRRCLGDLLSVVERQPGLARDAARWLEASAIEGRLPDVEFGYEPRALADEFALAEDCFSRRAVPLAQVRDLLGHASITTTERYDNQKLENLFGARQSRSASCASWWTR